MKKKLNIRKATVGDVKSIHTLINKFASKEQMLPRSLNDIYENLRDFFVCERNGETIATSALHISWEDLAEIRSVVVSKSYQNQGIGKKLVAKCLKEAKGLGLKRVFALTYNPGFFGEMGFQETDKNDLPHKIWGDCVKCPKFPDCNEVAVIKDLD
jgi:amino-acid N-acetyltransferase